MMSRVRGETIFAAVEETAAVLTPSITIRHVVRTVPRKYDLAIPAVVAVVIIAQVTKLLIQGQINHERTMTIAVAINE